MVYYPILCLVYTVTEITVEGQQKYNRLSLILLSLFKVQTVTNFSLTCPAE